MKRSLLFVLSVILFGVRASAQVSTVPPKTDTDRLAALKLSQLCQAEGQNYARSYEGGNIVARNVQTHYNRVQNRCLLQLDVLYNKSERRMIVDPVDNVEFAIIHITHNYTPAGTAKATMFVNECFVNQWDDCPLTNRTGDEGAQRAREVFPAYAYRVMDKE